MQKFQSPPLTKINKTIMITSVGIFVLSAIMEKSTGTSLLAYFGLSAKALFNGHVYQLLTFPLIERSFMAIIFNNLIIWFVGSELEAQWGRKLYTQFLLTCSISTGIIYLIITAGIMGDALSMSFPLFGLSSLSYGLLGAYAMIYSDRYLSFMFLFPIKAIWFCALLGGIQLYSAITSAYSKSAWAHLAGLFFGIAFLRVKSFLIAKRRQHAEIKKKEARSKSGLYIVKEDDDDTPKYFH
jgi:membrane associated rhomboid family serine protease